MVACAKALDFTLDSGGGGHRLLCSYSKKFSGYVELVTATVFPRPIPSHGRSLGIWQQDTGSLAPSLIRILSLCLLLYWLVFGPLGTS